MKKIGLVILLLVAPLIVFAGDNTKEQTTFESKALIFEWAEESSWGGWSSNEFDYSNTQILVVFRSFTSGIESSDVSIFVKSKAGNKWQRSFYKDAIRNDFITVSQDENQLIFRKSSDEQLIFVVSLDFLSEESY